MASHGEKLENLIKARQKAGQVYVSSAIGLALNKSTANLDRVGEARRNWLGAKQAVVASEDQPSERLDAKETQERRVLPNN
jgi:hypothetical protein